ncbi:MAG: hypothetical protein ACI3VE_05730 [Oscillospiraceae bacterium]
MKEKITKALTTIFSVTIFIVMLLALLVAVIYIAAFVIGTSYSESLCGFSATYIQPVIYIATIIDCLLGVVIMYLKKEYVFVLDTGAKNKKF